jgi:hypothetical protein
MESKRQAGHAQAHLDEFGGDEVAARTALQIADFSDLTPAQMIFRLGMLAPRAVAGRQRRENWFGPDHRAPAYGAPNLGSTGLKLEDMCNMSLARDVWIHRFEIAEATGRDPSINRDIDDVILGGVVAEWCERHGEAVDLVLTGPLGGHFASGTDGPGIRMDAIDFCRVLAGRPPRQPAPQCRLLETLVPF